MPGLWVYRIIVLTQATPGMPMESRRNGALVKFASVSARLKPRPTQNLPEF